jgi:hypothetical protein
MDIGIFIPIGNNGWLISTTAPQYMPTFALNREIVQKAERCGLDFRAVHDQAARLWREKRILRSQPRIVHPDGGFGGGDDADQPLCSGTDDAAAYRYAAWPRQSTRSP